MLKLELTRVHTFQPFIDFFDELGAPTYRCLKELGLPDVGGLEDDSALVPVSACLRFIEEMSCSQGVQDAPILIAQRKPANTSVFDVPEHLLNGVSLLETLENFLAYCRMIQPSLNAGIEVKEGELRVSINYPRQQGYEMADWVFILQLIGIVRKFTGDTWAPGLIGLRSGSPPSQLVCESFSVSRILSRQESNYIQFPIKILCTSEQLLSETIAADFDVHSAARHENTSEFATNIKCVMRSYLHDPALGIDYLAHSLCCSVRTLQRQLFSMNLEYRRLMQEARYEVAAELLQDQGLQIIEVSQRAGYSDPSHFSRAFRRLSGVSPLQYRRCQSESLTHH